MTPQMPPQMTSPAKVVPSTPRAQRTRARILDSAGHCFADRGFAKTTVEEIARQAGVSKALVYVHFEGKEDLLAKVLERTLEEWRSYNWTEVDRRAGGSALESIAVMHRASIDYARKHPVLRTILIRDERLLLSQDDEPVRRSTQGWRRRLISVLEGGIQSGELRADLGPEEMADVVRLWHLAFLDRLYAESLIDVTDERLIEASIEVMKRGLAAPAI